MPLRHGLSPWAASLRPARRRAFPRLTSSLEIPVVIVGGGLTGCATAYALSAAGVRVVLLEGDQLAGGATSRASGLLLARPEAAYLELERRHGRRIARALWQDTRRAALDAQATLRRLKIRSGLATYDAVLAARAPDDVKVLRRELAAQKAAGIDGSWLSARALEQATGLEGHGGIRSQGHAWVDPVKTTLGLARAAAARGAAIFERSPVDRIRFGRRHVEITCGRRVITAETVIVATGGPGTLFRPLARHFVETETYAVLTPKMSAAVRRAGGARASIVLDRHDPPHRLCWFGGDRILWTGADQPPVPERKRREVMIQRTGQLMYELLLALPVISGTQPDFSWHAPVVRAVDEVPFVGPHRNYPRHLFALGLGANLAASFHAARLLVRAVQGAPERSDEYFGFTRLAGR
ncbi:MAG TPA: FAD-binding oxidoreductase [Vicinamibacterales bacterium]